MDKSKLLPTLAAGFAASVLSTVPGLKNMGCCLFIPFAAVFAIFLYKKINHVDDKVQTGQAILFGVLTGLFAAFFTTLFDVIITFATKTNDFIEVLPQTEAAMRELNIGPMLDNSIELLRLMAKQIRETGFSAIYTIGIFLSNLLIFIIFGMLGGLLGKVLLNRRYDNSR